MDTGMGRVYRITFASAAALIAIVFCINLFLCSKDTGRTLKAGFVYVGDASTAYTNNFYHQFWIW